MSSQAENEGSLELSEPGPGNILHQRLLTAGGVLGALAASSCCIAPLALFGLGVSGAWIGNLTRLAPYQPCFIAATVACLGGGYWLLYRFKKDGMRGRPSLLPAVANRTVKMGLILATVLVIGALAFDFLAPLLL